jgi:hypothetical protein
MVVSFAGIGSNGGWRRGYSDVGRNLAVVESMEFGGLCRRARGLFDMGLFDMGLFGMGLLGGKGRVPCLVGSRVVEGRCIIVMGCRRVVVPRDSAPKGPTGSKEVLAVERMVFVKGRTMFVKGLLVVVARMVFVTGRMTSAKEPSSVMMAQVVNGLKGQLVDFCRHGLPVGGSMRQTKDT